MQFKRRYKKSSKSLWERRVENIVSTIKKMDIRLNIIQSVVNYLTDKVDNATINIVQDALIIELNNYEIQERCTELAVHDSSNESIIKKFVATKRVEGTAESTLKRYMEQNFALISLIGKPLKEISTYDIRFYLSVKRERDKLSNRTLDGMRRCYNSFFKWAVNEGYITKNPCASISQIKYKKNSKKNHIQQPN